MVRYFKAPEQVYEDFRHQLDAAFGLPDLLTQTSIEPAATAPRNAAGQVLLSVLEEFLAWPETQKMLQDAIASEKAADATEHEFMDAVRYAANIPPPYPTATPTSENLVPDGPNKVRLL